MDDKQKRLCTTVRLDEEASSQIYKLMEQSGSSQSEVIRHLVDVALGDTSKYVFGRTDAGSDDETKTLYMNIANNLADIRNELNRIGQNINVRRRNYNYERKKIEDEIAKYDTRIETMQDNYLRIKAQVEQQDLKQELKKFDSKETEFVTETEWERFHIMQIAIENLMITIGDKL